MPRKHYFDTTAHRSSLVIGDPSLVSGSTSNERMLCQACYETEYDAEFAPKQGLDAEKHVPLIHASPRWPSSFKKHYIHRHDYAELENQYHEAHGKVQELGKQISDMQAQMGGWRRAALQLQGSLNDEYHSLDAAYDHFSGLTSRFADVLENLHHQHGLLEHLLEGELRQPPIEAENPGSTAVPPPAAAPGKLQAAIPPPTPGSVQLTYQQSLGGVRQPHGGGGDAGGIVVLESPGRRFTGAQAVGAQLQSVQEQLQALSSAVQALLERRGKQKQAVQSKVFAKTAATTTAAAEPALPSPAPAAPRRPWGSARPASQGASRGAGAPGPVSAEGQEGGAGRRRRPSTGRVGRVPEPIEGYPKDELTGLITGASRGYWIP